MNEAIEAKALLSDTCCTNCFNYSTFEHEKDIFFSCCFSSEAFINGCLTIEHGIKNITKPTNTCPYFSDKYNQPAPMPIFQWTLPNEE